MSTDNPVKIATTTGKVQDSGGPMQLTSSNSARTAQAAALSARSTVALIVTSAQTSPAANKMILKIGRPKTAAMSGLVALVGGLAVRSQGGSFEWHVVGHFGRGGSPLGRAAADRLRWPLERGQ